MRKRYQVLLLAAVGFGLIAATAVHSQLPAGQPDVFDKSNQAKVDPFSELFKAPPVDLKASNATSPTQPGTQLRDGALNVSPVTTVKPDKKTAGAEVNPAPRTEKVFSFLKFQVTAAPPQVKRGEIVRVTVTGMPLKGYHTFAMNVTAPKQFASVFKVGDTSPLWPLGPILETPPPALVVEAGEGVWQHSSQFTWAFDVLVTSEAKIGAVEFPFGVMAQVCKESCFPATEFPLLAKFTVLPGDVVAIPAEIEQRHKQTFPPKPIEKIADGSSAQVKEPLASTKIVGLPSDYQASIDRISQQLKAPGKGIPDGEIAKQPDEGLWAFVLAGMFWGFVSLLTPCVFPMIPITVSFFLKQSEKEHHKPVTMALVYCGTIVVVLTVAAAALLSFFRVLSVNPAMNIGLGLLFIFFALSLFGMYEIELPSFLARFTSERESKGGMVGTIFMALTFTIISFACVAPFLGGFGGTAAGSTRPIWHTILGGLAFSVTFASPFFILALFPTLLKAMPKSGAWLNSVKVVMGFLELAAAFKFFRAGELRLVEVPSLFTFDLVLGLWIALCLLCGAYLLGLYRLPHDSQQDHLGVPRMMFSFLFLGLALYLLPGLFVKPTEDEQPRPGGAVYAWVKAFLLPEINDDSWTGNLEDAIAQAREYRRRTGKTKLVFVDFTGVTCSNCRLNETNVFPKYEIRQLFKQYVLARLYTDTVPPVHYSDEDRLNLTKSRQDRDGKINLVFQRSAFDTDQLPLYVILEPQLDDTIRILGKYDEGKISSESAFAAFLRKPQTATGSTVAAR